MKLNLRTRVSTLAYNYRRQLSGSSWPKAESRRPRAVGNSTQLKRIPGLGRGAMWVGASLFSIYALVTTGFDVSEGREHAEVASRLLHHGEIARPEPLTPNWVRGIDGRYYSAHEAANAVAMIPAVWLSGRVEQLTAVYLGGQVAPLVGPAILPLAAALYAAITAGALFVACVSALKMPMTQAAVASWALGLTTILAPYSRMLYDGVLGGAFVAWSIAFATLAADRSSRGWAIAAGLMAGAAFATRQPLLILALAPLAHLAWDAHAPARKPLVLAFMIGIVPAVIWQGWYNLIRTGAFYVPAAALPQFANLRPDGNPLQGLIGMLASPGKSLFLYSPILLLAIPGVRSLMRDGRWLGAGIATAVALYALLHAPLRNWSGEWGWGPRYLVPVTMPLMLLAVAFARRVFERERRAMRHTVCALLVVGLVVQVIAVTSNWHYVYAWLYQQGDFDAQRLAWSLTEGQFAETTTVWVENMRRLFEPDIPVRVVPNASALTIAASNRLNVWPVVAVYAGIPITTIALAVALIALVSAVTTYRAWTVCREPERA